MPIDRIEPGEKFPSNSYTSKAKKKEIQKVVKKSVSAKEQSLGSKVADTFFATNGHDIMDYVIFDVLIPGIKSAAKDILNGALNMLFDGTRKPDRIKREKGKSYVYTSYDGYYDKRERDEPPARARTRSIFQDLIFETRDDAEEVLETMAEIIDEYEVVTVKDLYALAGKETNYTMDKYGWYELTNASVERIRNGYLLKLPKPIAIDD